MRYYIYDANNTIFGNPKGYDKHSSAIGIATRYRHKLWAIYDARDNKASNVIYETKLM